MKIRSGSLIVVASVAGLALSLPSANAFVSKPATIAAKKIAVELAQASIAKALRRAENLILKQHGPEGLAKLKDVARATGKEGAQLDEFLVLASRHRDDFSKLLRSGDDAAMQMVCRNGEAGRFLFSRFYGQAEFGKGSQWFLPQSDQAIQEAWNLVRPAGGVKGSWLRLRECLTKAGLNNTQRDFAEVLFANRVGAGKIRQLKGKTLLAGHPSGTRQGADFFVIDKKTGRPGILEFGTGKKPDGNAVQMTPEWCRNEWLKFIQQPSNRTLLREQGVDPQFLNPKFVSSDQFVTGNAFERIVCSPEINLAAANRLGVQTILLP